MCPPGWPCGSAGAFDKEAVHATFCLRFEKRVTGRPAERLEILHRARVRREHLQRASRRYVLERLLGPQDRQGAIQALYVKNLVCHLDFLCRYAGATMRSAQM